jgi:hypothetical protein
MGVHYGQVGRCLWSYHSGQTSDEDWAVFIEYYREFNAAVIASGELGAAITFTWKAAVPSAKRRKQLADMLSLISNRKVLAGHAMVTDSRAMQVGITALDWIVKKSYPEKVFVSAADALDWLNAQRPIQRTGIVDAVLRDVPAGQRDPAFVYVDSQQAAGGR